LREKYDQLGRQAEYRNFVAGQTGLQPHRVESNQDDLGKGEDGWWFEGCIEGSSRLRAFNISAMSRLNCASYDSFGVWLSDRLMNGANRSSGTGKMVVV
jgi:hypothetical protein